MSVFFVTGTDTEVGKTITSRAIMQAMQDIGIQIVGYKPLACSKHESIYSNIEIQPNAQPDKANKDVLVLLNSTAETVQYQDINSYTFTNTMPMFDEKNQCIDINKINADLKRLASRYQSVLVEGAFGWMTPMNKDYTFGEWVAEHKMPVVLVVGIKEGCINHALLTVQSIEKMGLPLLGWVANRINPGLGHYAEIIETLSNKIDAPLLGQIPYIYKPEEQQLGGYITNLERLKYMKTEWVD